MKVRTTDHDLEISVTDFNAEVDFVAFGSGGCDIVSFLKATNASTVIFDMKSGRVYEVS